MSNKSHGPAQTEEEIPSFEFTDEALEAAAAAAPAEAGAMSFNFCTSRYVCPCW
jgi:hypothetical protein